MLWAAGPHFCTGGRYDKKQLGRAPTPWWLTARGICGSGHVLDQIRASSVVSISVLHGSSIGGGLLLGLTADHRVATDHATFRLGVAPYGLSPIVMATQVLPALTGQPFSNRMYAEDLSIDRHYAARLGIADHLFADTQAARRFARSSARAASQASSWFLQRRGTIEAHDHHHDKETL